MAFSITTKKPYLHTVIVDVLERAGKPLSVREIQQRIFKENLWQRPKDGMKPLAEQISARVNNYDHLFLRKNGTVSLNKYINEKRVARLCWNDKGWILPSGRNGKSDYKGSHEFTYGYGHEEWIFDLSKLINGFHYAFLEPVRKQQQAYQGNSYDVWLYSIDASSNKRYHNGEIRNLQAINEHEAERVMKVYQKNGWHDEMKMQLNTEDIEGFSEYLGLNMFNVKFKPEDLYYEDYIELPSAHPVSKGNRYSFTKYTEDYDILKDDQGSFKFISSSKVKSTKILKTHSLPFIKQPKAIQNNLLHSELSIQLTTYLEKLYGKRNVTAEHPVNGNNRIDIVVNHRASMTFYEIKTYADVRTSVREALGQILEYCFYSDTVRATEMIIVTPKPKELKRVTTYVTHLRNITGLKIYYQFFDIGSNKLSDKY